MGVHGLWELLSPVGRRVSVETLAGKRLAIDASIWMVQFMKAMRDERGEMVRNAHLLGFFRRICKLLFLRTKPVFVFDGATPELKRRTVAARRRHRDSAQAKVRKTAEKLLLNHLKAMRLQELADNIKNQRKGRKNGADSKKVLSNHPNMEGNEFARNDPTSVNITQEKLDEMLAASIMAEENESLANNSVMSDAITCDEDCDEEMILPDIGEVDPAVLSTLTPSLQLELLQKQKRYAKGKQIVSDSKGSNSGMEEIVSNSCNQEKLDEMLAASLMEEEKRSIINNVSTSTYPVEDGGNMDGDEDGYEDEEMIVPAMDGGIDPSILASLPPSMQLDLLVQIRERLMAENRQKYQRVKKDPGKFSELQIQAYLKTVAFRREIDQVQKAASGRGIGGVQTSRIASEANREFIFSSSFTGDKQVLLSGGAEKCGDKPQLSEEHSTTFMHPEASTSKSKSVTESEELSSSVMHSATASKSKSVSGFEECSIVMHSAASTSKSKTVTGPEPNRARRAFHDKIETYIDEQGRVRVSRVRAMGIRMTRDIQRNLDLMAEQERENVDRFQSESNSAVPTTLSGDSIIATSQDVAESIRQSNADKKSVLNGDTSIEFSLEDDSDIKCLDGDDDIFTRLVAENPVLVSSDNITPPGKLSDSDQDCDWVEGTTEANGKTLSEDTNLSTKPPLTEGYNSDSEVDWEEGGCEDSEHNVSPLAEKSKLYSKGYLEEEADIQEALRRSLGDLQDHALAEDVMLELSDRNACKDDQFLDSEYRTEEPINVEGDGIQNMSTCEILDGMGEIIISRTVDTSGGPLKSSILCNRNEATPGESHIGSPKQCMQSASKSASSPDIESLVNLKVREVNIAAVADQKTVDEAEPSSPLVKMTNSALPFSEEQMTEIIFDIGNEEILAEKKSVETEHGLLENSALEEDEDCEMEATEAHLEEELKILGEERLSLVDDRRRLERNAESVNGEMFIECQELLQMFGIPYIIAPMEAEAQCAFMEIANLVDGVVTDDSDVFLFGARSVYKNIFDDRKYVETYFMKDIENEFGMTREKLISMALLLGSDYTEGVSGIGIVNAIEVLNAFPEEGGLKEFRDWIESPDPSIFGKVDEQSDLKARRKGSKRGKNDNKTEEVSASHENSSEAKEQKQSADDVQDTKRMFMDKHRKVSKNWHIPLSFPSSMVISAYLSPEIDQSTDPFSWGKPDPFVLRKLCWEKFSWNSHKADELILPVLKEYNKSETQLRMEAFYTFNERFAKIRSKRITKAAKGITGKKSSGLMDNSVSKVSGSKNKRKSKIGEVGDDQSEKLPKQSKKRAKLGDNIVSESTEVSDCTKKRTQRSGRSRGRGRGRASRKGKGQASPIYEVSETSSSDVGEEEVHMETRESVELRRSGRAQKPADYTEKDSETDDLNYSVDEEELNCISKLAASGPHLIENVSPGQGLETDYLDKGRGFCSNDCDNDQPDAEEYLKTGGGFCMDEDETRPDENSRDVIEENAFLNRNDRNVVEPTDPSSEKIMSIPVGALRSMPNLRKKRRNS